MSEPNTVDVERRLREKSRGIVLKPHLSGKSDVWKNFSLVFEQRHDVHVSASVEKLIELKYLCACNGNIQQLQCSEYTVLVTGIMPYHDLINSLVIFMLYG